MSRNLVRQHRGQLSMTQRELAEKVGTSQQQIQRIETGKIAAKLGIAQTICTVLNKPLQAVFPEAEKSLTAFRNKGSQRDEDLSEIANDGIEMDAFAWTVKLFLSGHEKPLFLPILSADKRRFHSYFYEEADNNVVPFFVFDSDKYRFALNIREVAFHQFLSDPVVMQREEVSDDEEGRYNVWITLTDGTSVIPVSVEADEASDENSDGTGQLDNIFSLLEDGPSPGQRFHLTDEDGETAFVRTGSVAMLQVALDVLNPVESDE